MALAVNTSFPLLLFLHLYSLTSYASSSSDHHHHHHPAVFNFGDSNSDTGNLVSGVGEQLHLPYGETHFHRTCGRFCDGRLVLDFLMDGMGLPYLNPYLDSVGTPSFRTGSNFAAAGSTILPAKPFFRVPILLWDASSAIRPFQIQSTRADRSCKKYLPREEYFENGLYILDIGQNDLAGAFYTKTEDQILASIPTILLEFENGIKRLLDHGARKFWVHNTGPLGCLPENIARFGREDGRPSGFDEIGCLASHNRVARFFNLQLHALCAKLRGIFPDANFTYTDVFAIKSDLMANYTRLGFKKNIMTCCGYGGPPVNYDPEVRCGQTKVMDGSAPVTASGCNDTTSYVIWDGIHYTEAANLHVAKQILSGKYSDPPPSPFSFEY